MSTLRVCPECAQGKHQNCTQFVLDEDDNLIPCEHPKGRGKS